MKKKIILAVLMVAMLVCLFAISVSASDLAYDRVYTIDGVEYPLWEQDADGNYHPLMWYQDGDKLSYVYADNTDKTKAPYVTYSAYTQDTSREMQNFNITDANGNTFNGKSTVVIANLHNVYVKAGDTNQITHLHKNAFNGSTVLKAVYIPESIVYLGWYGSSSNFVAFQDCKALEYAEIAPSATLTAISPNTFLNCTALKAISLPNSIKTLDQVSFASCTSLQAVYLSSNLETFVYNGWNKGAFYNCANLYFVNEPFTIDNIQTDMPKKPDIYYFPAGLSALGDCFRGCMNINDTLVFGDKLLVVDSTIFTATGSKGDVKTSVFTGNMTKFYLGEGFDATWNFVFTNTTDESIFSTRTDRAFGNSYGYLCKTDRRVLFNYGVKWSDGTEHFVDVRKSEFVNATCTTDEVATTYCFCGAKIGTTSNEGTALGHEYDLMKGAVKSKVEYANYLATGMLYTKCARCTECQTSDVNPIIADFKGFSVRNDGDGITFGYTFDKDAIKEFEEVNKTTLSFGFVAGVKAFLGDKMILDEGAANVINATVDKSYTAADFVLRGNWDREVTVNQETVNVKNVEFYMAGYMILNGEVIYLNLDGSSQNAGVITFAECDAPEETE